MRDDDGPQPSLFALPLADLAVKAAVILVAAAVLARLMGRASAASRHLVWTAALGAVLLLPIARAALPAMPVSVLPAAPAPAPDTLAPGGDLTLASEISRPRGELTVGTSSIAAIRATAARPGVEQARREARVAWTWPGALVAIWLAGVGGLLARAAVGAIGVRRLTRGASRTDNARLLARVRQVALELSLRRPVVVLVAERDLMPATWGVTRPTILLPLSAATWADQRLDTVLVHELAHVARFDALSDGLARLAVILFWFNPLTWFAARQARLEAEMACDDLVLGQGTRPSLYAEDLLFLLQTMSPPAPSSATLATARGSRLVARIHGILDVRVNRRGLSRGSVALGATLLLLMLPMAAARLAAREGPPAPVQRPLANRVVQELAPAEPVRAAASAMPATQRADVRQAMEVPLPGFAVQAGSPEAGVEQGREGQAVYITITGTWTPRDPAKSQALYDVGLADVPGKGTLTIASDGKTVSFTRADPNGMIRGAGSHRDRCPDDGCLQPGRIGIDGGRGAGRGRQNRQVDRRQARDLDAVDVGPRGAVRGADDLLARGRRPASGVIGRNRIVLFYKRAAV